MSEQGTDRPIVAAFDFDGTLTTGGSVFPFLVSIRGLGPVVAALLVMLPKLVRAAIVGGSTADRFKEQLFVRLLNGQNAEVLRAASTSFAREHLAHRLRPKTKERLKWHQSLGHTTVVVSASPESYIGPAAAMLGCDGGLATKMALDESGNLTGRYDGENCRGAVKYQRLVEWLGANGMGADNPPFIWAYGNSRGDLKLLESADRGIDAGRLKRFGRLRSFKTLDALRHEGAKVG